MGWEDFLATLELSDQPRPPSAANVLYLAQHDLLMQFPGLRADIIIPDYVYASIDPQEFPDYHPPGNEEELVINAWLGPKGTISPAHTVSRSIFDTHHSLKGSANLRILISIFSVSLTLFQTSLPIFDVENVVQIVGHKTVWLAPPDLGQCMYPYATFIDINSPSVSPSMINTSRVDVFAPVDPDFPEFRDRVIPVATVGALYPGDLLFIPPGWWHAMRSEETSFSVSMWF
jgi:hypothetical protein